MLEMMTMGKMQIPPPDIRGEAIFTASGIWTCPPDVFSISYVVIGPGVNGDWSSSYARGGDGGALRYRNNVPVVPGQTYSIVIGTPGGTSTAFGTTVGQYNRVSGPFDGGGNGGQASSYSGQGTGAGRGGQGAYYTTGGSAGTQNLNIYIGPGLYGNNQGSSYGAGGGAEKDGGGSGKSYPGRGGACRIMWGRYRSFPSAAT